MVLPEFNPNKDASMPNLRKAARCVPYRRTKMRITLSAKLSLPVSASSKVSSNPIASEAQP